ncbi:MAG: hypothetical protein AMJ62_12310 [Myxococcales bacterium SG8_38]|nr:MAG: hypothetical protein AMJ62_12310 [Myxococcales bacterium SG8_38]
MKNLIVTVCMAAALFTVACKKKKTAGPPPPELAVTLVDPGAAPRETLQYAIPSDTVMRSFLDVHDIEAASEDSEYASNAFGVLPGVKLQLHVGPTVSLPNGARYVLRVSSAESVLPDGVSDREMEEVEAGVRALRGMRGRFDVNRQGVVMEADVPWEQGQERIHPRVTIMIGNLRSAIATIPVPREPVGIGAVWEVRRPLRIWSARVTQVTRYQLTDRVGDRFRVAITVEQKAAPQTADLNPRLEMRVRSYEMRARGHALADLGLPLALEAQLESSSAAEIALVSPEKTEPLTSVRRSVVRLVSQSGR